MILYEPRGEAVRSYQESVQRLAAVEATALDFGDLSASFWAYQYRKVVRRAMEAELDDPMPAEATRTPHCLLCAAYRGNENGAHL